MWLITVQRASGFTGDGHRFNGSLAYVREPLAGRGVACERRLRCSAAQRVSLRYRPGSRGCSNIFSMIAQPGQAVGPGCRFVVAVRPWRDTPVGPWPWAGWSSSKTLSGRTVGEFGTACGFVRPDVVMQTYSC